MNKENNMPQKLTDQMKREIEKLIDLATRRSYDKRVGDTPNDALQLVPKKYVNLNGLVANRPSSSVASVGQFFLATNTGLPMWYTTAGWVDGVGSVIAQA